MRQSKTVSRIFRPLIKYPGGKDKELSIIAPRIPNKVTNYYEPFFGGGAVYFALTRARKGLVICVPEGNANKTVGGFWEDTTRIPEYYDGTYAYLKSLGLEEI